ncbi:MAG TPA: LuxR C-terminal-related transcriptional regulator [Kineosporiaceae bacterium]|nr:LuxR C-terminal-related transcriptional regulator [Kineosporiaceae bacterium]
MVRKAGGYQRMPERPDYSQHGRSSIPPPAKRGNLPAQLSSLVGRHREIAVVTNLLRTSRLVTLTGVGGVGKTRLALRVAADSRRAFHHGVWFIDLAEVRGRGPFVEDVGDAGVLDELDELGLGVLVYPVMSALDMRPRGAGSAVRELTDYLTDRRALLVLDNCEHLLPECTRLVDRLLAACPQLRVLATSREPLEVAGQVRYPVQPLAVPTSAQPLMDDFAGCESVALFVERAQAAVPSFTLTKENRDSVAHLCGRLEGLPLAIEMAAARVRVLTPQQISERLTDRFRLLSSRNRAAPAHQQTLLACVTWSFELCSKPEQLLWSRLSTFVGGFELDAVEEVCADETLPGDELMEVLTGLVEKSIVDRLDPGDLGEQARYRMLETFREFGRKRLIQADEEALLRRRHGDWCRQLVDRANTQWASDRQVFWFTRLTHERANLRAAVEFCLSEPGEIETGVHIVATMPRVLWANGGLAREGLGWLDRALTERTMKIGVRAHALAVAAALALLAGDIHAVRGRLEQARQLGRRLDDPFVLAYCAYVDAVAAWLRNDLGGAIEAADRGLSSVSRMTDPDLPLRLHLLIHAQWATAMSGDQRRSKQYSHDLLEILEGRGESASRSMVEWGVALAAWRAGELEESARHVRESVRIRHKGMPYLQHAALNLELMAWIAAEQRRFQRSAILLGAADSLLTEHGTPISTAFLMLLADHRTCQRRTREDLDNEAFTEAFQRGQALTLDEALAYAVEAPEAESISSAAEPVAAPLTRREYQIAQLVADGLSNKEIAGTLVISRRTVEGHVDHILTKLGFRSRAQIASWITSRSAVRRRGGQSGT